AARATALRRLADERWDVLIVGGGIVGSGALLDATSRGLKAALVEQLDIASGTSGRSSRLIHGGLRYLEQLHFGLVAEALEERSRLLRLAPQLVRLEPFLFPVYGIPLVHQGFYGSGILLYDLLGARRDGGFSRHLRPSGAREYAPSLRRRGLTGGIVYHDGVEDDARLALTVLRTALASEIRPVAVTRVRAEAPSQEHGRIAGARVRDLLTDTAFDVRADRVIDATGVWSARPDERFASAGATTSPDNGQRHGHGRDAAVTPSRGSHVIIRRDRLEARGGMTLRIPGRVVFIIPWPDHWIIGTTDHLDGRAPDRLSAPNADVDELLSTVNAQTNLELSRRDLVGTYAGMRPLVGGSGDSTVKTSREHRVSTDPSGVVRIGGGKYTTYRVMARDVVDAALGRTEAKRRPSRTAELPLLGAAPLDELDREARAIAASAPNADGIAAARLVARHGTEARRVLALGSDLGLVGGDGRPQDLGAERHLAAEVAWAARQELALSLDDVLARRFRLAQVLPDRGAAIAAFVAELLGRELGWDAARRAREVGSYLDTARSEYGVPWPET
ncbi:MAG TPA: glycerol-3-phosphate dehydrogenase/oxidase, partial [Candidatus Limnocylindrales bacterium]|nr:glycerol-3-phosphate dehydrogenase/oxidase [Candidatus Limnocylindrales bacterium]